MATSTQQDPAGANAANNRSGSPEAREDGLMPVSGILDVGDSNAFIRTSGFRMGPDDVYVPASQVRQYGLRKGDHVKGLAQRPADGQGQDSRRARGGGTPAGRPGAERRNGRGAQDTRNSRPGRTREKASFLASVDTVNGMPAAQARTRPHFESLTALYAAERIRLESGSDSATARIIDIVAPIGKGQRGLIVSPPKAGKTMILKEIAQAIINGQPGVHLMMVLVGERPEEVTDIRRTVKGEIVYSTFDRPASDHILAAELAIERAKRLVEQGKDVVILLDSITRLARAYNTVAPSSSRILAGGVATSALQPPRTFLGAARNVEDGGSLTILSTALIETGSRMDDVFFEEFKGTGNLEVRLRRDLAEKRLYPAIDIAASSTRREDLLMSSEEFAAVGKLRRALAGLDAQQGLDRLLDRTRETSSNGEFLRQLQDQGSRSRGFQIPGSQRD
jgi:transcription termination factor Rho